MNEHAGHRARLRESYREKGIEGMADHQVLELLLTYALPRVDVNPLAHRLLDRFGSLNEVLSARPDQLQQVQGVGESAAVFLSLLGQVDRRMLLRGWSASIRSMNSSTRVSSPPGPSPRCWRTHGPFWRRPWSTRPATSPSATTTLRGT